jgi:hypothetical protein
MTMGVISEALRSAQGKATILNEQYTDRLVRKYEPLIGNDIKDPYRRKILAMLFENTINAVQRGDALMEETRAAQAGPYIKYIFPMIRRVFANLIAPNIVSVQPMTSPVSGIFFFRYRYGTTKGEVTAGSEMAHPLQFNRYYTSELVFNEAIGVGNGSNTTFSKILDFTPVRGATLTVTAGSVTGTDDGNGNITGTGISGSINYTTGALNVTFTTAPADGVAVTATYRYNMELNPKRPKINLDIQVIEVRAVTRSLVTEFSAEAMDDLRALHGIEADAEFTVGASAEIATEIDREIINDLLNAALTPDPVFGVSSATFDAQAPSGVSKTDHLRGILFAISKVSEQIHRKTLRKPANWIVCGPKVAAILNTLPFFTKADDAEYTYQGSIVKIGKIQDTWTVYKDPLFPEVVEAGVEKSKILVGYQGASFLDTGYVYAPYVPLQVTPLFYDPRTLGYTKGFRTRYATKLVRPEFYGYVEVTNLQTL